MPAAPTATSATVTSAALLRVNANRFISGLLAADFPPLHSMLCRKVGLCQSNQRLYPVPGSAAYRGTERPSLELALPERWSGAGVFREKPSAGATASRHVVPPSPVHGAGRA